MNSRCALYFKEISGWANIIDLSHFENIDVSLPSTGNIGRRIRNPNAGNEYFLVENRGSGDKWAASVPDTGIAIWHIDENKSGNDDQNGTAALHYEVALEQADGLFDLENDRDRGDAQDLFDNSSQIFRGSSMPSSKWWSGAVSGVQIKVLSAPGASMDVQFGQQLPVGAVVVLSPNGGETLKTGSDFGVYWDANISGNVRIELYRSGVPFQVLAASTPNDGYFVWTIPNNFPIYDEFSIHVISESDPANRDSSDAKFTVTSELTLIPWSASNWKYYSQNVNLGTSWRSRTYNDVSWLSGGAELGYGDGDEVTTIYSPTSRYATVYFRKHFSVLDSSKYSSLNLKVTYDDAYAAYLNGSRIAGNLPTNPSYDFFSGGAIDDAATVTIENLPVTSLAIGDNVIAVEVHQASSSSSDLSMNLSLTANVAIIPDIVVEESVGNFLVDEVSTIDFGHVNFASTPVARIVKVKNVGSSKLAELSITKSGANSGDFSISAPATISLLSGASTTFSVTFNPVAAGERSAAIQIYRSLSDTAPFDIKLFGRVRSPIESWRVANFGSESNLGDYADTADKDGDGLVNLFEYYFGLDPHVPESSPFVIGYHNSQVSVTYSHNLSAVDVQGNLEYTTDLALPWAPVSAILYPGPIENGIQMRTLTPLLPNDLTRVFLRLKISQLP